MPFPLCSALCILYEQGAAADLKRAAQGGFLRALTRRTALFAAGTGLLPLASRARAAATVVGPEVRGLKLGYIALTDAAPLIVAQELGYFARHGMPTVELIEQSSWDGTRENLALGAGNGGLDGAHILTPMAYLLHMGRGAVNNIAVPMAVVLRLNTNGQAISVANAIEGATVDCKPLKSVFAAKPGNRVAMTFRGGTHDLWLRYWLAAGGIDPERDVKTIVVAPPQMVANMKVGTMDAFCAGEPWNDQLVHQKFGYTACITGEIWRDHPEKSLALRADWVVKNPRAAQALTAAVIQAQMWADQPANKPQLATMLGRRAWFNVPPSDILPRSLGDIDYGDGRTATGSPVRMKFWADHASYPFQSHDLWFLTENQRWGLLPRGLDTAALVKAVNREDIWRAAASSIGAAAPKSTSRGVQAFFDGVTFDPADPDGYLAKLQIRKVS